MAVVRAEASPTASPARWPPQSRARGVLGSPRTRERAEAHVREARARRATELAAQRTIAFVRLEVARSGARLPPARLRLRFLDRPQASRTDIGLQHPSTTFLSRGRLLKWRCEL